jgi:hypothetical protein
MMVGERKRQYPEWDKGPYIVYIRKIKDEINEFQMLNHITTKYKSAVKIKMMKFDKMRVEFESREEANKIPNDPLLEKYRVYVPHNIVESVGVVQLNINENEKELLKATGKFKNPTFKDVKILDVFRMTKRSIGKEGEFENTSFVKVSFEGKLLPDYVCCNKLLLPVRLYSQKPMFCENCNRYKHTKKYCCNKPQCGKCAGDHTTDECDKETLCLDCDGNHKTGSKDCPQRVFIQRKEMDKLKNTRKKTLADLFYGISDEMPGENPENYLTSPIHFPKLKKRKEPSKTKYDNIEEPKLKKKPQNSQPPPGFRKSSETNDPIWKLLQNFVSNLSISAMWKDLLIKFVVPIVHQFIPVIAASMFDNLNGLGLNRNE